jgi:hypothetical protein
MPSRRALKGASSAAKPFGSKASLLPHHLGLARMPAGPLWQNEETPEYKDTENRRRERTAQGKAAVVCWLVEEVAEGRAQRPG